MCIRDRYPIIREQKRLEKRLERIHREIDELSVQKLRQKKPAALPFASLDMLAANTLMSGTAKEVLQIGRQLTELEEALDDVSDRLSDYRFTIFQMCIRDRNYALLFSSSSAICSAHFTALAYLK